MPYANNQGVHIYYETEGSGPPLVLAHGIAQDLNYWRRHGYVDSLRSNFRLVLFDARGHGLSDKPHEASAYGYTMWDDVVSILDDVGLEKAHYFGYSMGAMVGFKIATRHPERFLSFILGSHNPYRDKSSAGSLATLFRLRMLKPEGSLIMLERMHKQALTSAERKTILAGDVQALMTLYQETIEWTPLTNAELAGIPAPCLIYCGDQDARHSGAKEGSEHIKQAKFVSLPGLDHFAAFERTDLVLPHVKEFLTEMGENQ